VTPKEEILEQIREAVGKTPVVLFMKGTPSFPQCGFSARAVQVLQEYGVEFRAVDVLENPLVREAIKEFSDWPTIPQLYVGGELVGGSDILVEMHENGELEPLLRKVTGAAESSEPA
jgi:monothiol glutaredoxin